MLVRAKTRRGITVNHRRALLNGFAACNERFQVADGGSCDAGRRHAVRAKSRNVLCAWRGATEEKRDQLTGGDKKREGRRTGVAVIRSDLHRGHRRIAGSAILITNSCADYLSAIDARDRLRFPRRHILRRNILRLTLLNIFDERLPRS